MALYKVYAGCFEAHYEGVFEFNSKEEAEHYAYELAVQDYQSYEGYHGLLDWEECKQDCIDSGWDSDDETVNERYKEEIESWIHYFVMKVTDLSEAEDE